MNALLKLQQFAGMPISGAVLLSAFSSYKRPYDKINHLVKNGHLLQLRRGLYAVAQPLAKQLPEPFLIANHLLGPSYVSLESALSFWGMIPERVYTCSSVTTRHSRKLHTPLGWFSYTHVPTAYYSLGLQQLSLDAQNTVLIGSPEKSLCDQIISTPSLQLRSLNDAYNYLLHDMRIETEELHKLKPELIASWLPLAPKKRSLEHLIKAITTC